MTPRKLSERDVDGAISMSNCVLCLTFRVQDLARLNLTVIYTGVGV